MGLEKREHSYAVGGMYIGEATVENTMEVSQETKLELPWNWKVKVEVAQLCPTLGNPMDYTVQYSWVSLVAQLVKNPPAMWDSYHMNQQLHSSVISEKNENTNLKRYMHPVFIIALFITAKIMEAT